MLRKKLGFLLIFGVFFLMVKPVEANNKVGIHILETTEVEKAASLVNSSGGDWGYLTIVMRENDLDLGKWQKFFNDCRQLHLIPIVRIATQITNDGIWTKPELEDLKKWSRFLNSLNWPVKQQIVVVFNEPNHAKEWEGEISPENYALVLDRLIGLLKKENDNFFVLSAGLDQAADGEDGTLDEVSFLQKMAKAVPDIFNKLDGWASHSYPNYGFIGRPNDKGRATIKGYEWELKLLKSLGLNKELPVFITETGWPHKEGVKEESYFYSEEKTADFLETALAVWEKDERVQAITPFVLNYPEVPFDHFSWFKKDGGFYKQYERVLGISKSKGLPEQVENYEVTRVDLDEVLPTQYAVSGKVRVKNTGQWIMGEREDFYFEVKQTKPELQISEIKLAQGNLVSPGEEVALNFGIQAGNQSAEHHLDFKGRHHAVYVFKPFDLKNEKVSLWRQIVTKLRFFSLQLLK